MPSPHGAASYRAVLRTPGAVRFFAPAMLGRLSFGLLGLGLVLAVTAAADSYAVVGAATAAYGATATALAPARARLIDRRGLPRTLVPMAVLAAAGLLALAWLTWRPGAPAWSLVAVPALVGAVIPPLGPVTRTLWSRLFHDRDDLRRRAYSLDAVVEEAVFLAGPLLLGALLPFAPPAAGLVHVAFAERHGGAALLVWFEVAQTAGGVVGGLLYGAVAWRRSPRTRLVALGLGVGAATALSSAAPGPLALCALLFAASVLATPAITTAYLAADEAAGPGRAVRAGAWTNTAFNAGASSGGAAAGLLVTLVAPAQGYLVAALPLVAVPLLAAGAAALTPSGRSGRPALRRRRPTPAAPRTSPQREGSRPPAPPADPRPAR